MTAISTIQVQVDGRQAVRTLQDIKAGLKGNTDAITQFHQMMKNSMGEVLRAVAGVSGAIDKFHRTMREMAGTSKDGAAAAIKQAAAMDKLAQAVNGNTAAKVKAAQAQRSELADQRALEAALNRKLSLEMRIARQLGGNADLQDRLTRSVTKYNSVVAASGANSMTGVKARGELQREFTRVSGEIAAIGGLLPKLNEIRDKIPAAKGASRITAADKAMMAAWAPDMAQQAIASGGNIVTPLLVQAPELAQVFGRLSTSTKAMVGGFAALAAAVGVVIAAMDRLSDKDQLLKNLNVSIRATGQQGILASRDLAKLVDEMDRLPGISRSAAEETVSGLSRIRGLGSEALSAITNMSADFAKAMGKDVPEAATALAKALADPAAGVKALNEQFGLMTAAEQRAVERMANSGRTIEAQRAILDKLRAQVKGMADESMSGWAHAADSMANAWGKFLDVLGNTGAIKGAADALRDLGDAMAGTMGDTDASRRLYERSFPKEFRDQMAARATQQKPGVLSLPMPAPLAPVAAAAAPGGVVDPRKEVADVLAMTDSLRGFRGERERLIDQAARVQGAMKLTTDPTELRMLREASAGIADALRQAVDPKAKLVADAQRGARNEWNIADSDWTDRDRLRTVIEAENQAREAGLSSMQREDLVRAKLSESAARYLTGIQDSVRTMGYQTDATERLAAVENSSLADRQRVADVLAKEEFRRQALSRATADNRDQILNEVAAFDQLIDRMGKAATASQYKSMAQGYSPTMQYEAFKKDAPGIEEAMRSGGAKESEIAEMYHQAEMRKLDASREWEDGVSRGLKRVQRDATDFARMSENAVTNAFSSMEDALVQFSMTGKLSFGDMARSIIADLMRMQVRMSIVAPLSGAMNGFFGNMFGGAKTGGGATGAPTSLMPGEWNGQSTPHIGSLYANGGAFSPMGKLHAFARGGAFTNSIVSEPTMFKFAKGGALGLMGEAGPEAIMPLRRGPDGSLGVVAAGGGGGTVNNIEPHISVTVEGSASSGDSEADAKQAQRIAKAVDGQIRATVVSELMKQMRGGGIMNRV